MNVNELLKIRKIALKDTKKNLIECGDIENFIKYSKPVQEFIAKQKFDGWTLLHLACHLGNEKAVNLLIDHSDVNTVDDFGSTPLHYATSVAIAEKLITCGADINAKDFVGFSALVIAYVNENYDLLNYLIDAGADVNKCSDKIETYIKIIKSYRESYFQSKNTQQNVPSN